MRARAYEHIFYAVVCERCDVVVVVATDCVLTIFTKCLVLPSLRLVFVGVNGFRCERAPVLCPSYGNVFSSTREISSPLHVVPDKIVNECARKRPRVLSRSRKHIMIALGVECLIRFLYMVVVI